MREEGGGLEYLKKRMLHHTEAKKNQVMKCICLAFHYYSDR